MTEGHKGYEYKFVRIDLAFWSKKPKGDYYQVVEEHANQGWRLVQIFAPPTDTGGAFYYELIFERSVR